MDQYTHAANEYKKASAAYEAATREAEKLARSLDHEEPALRGDGWQKVVVVNVPAEFPLELRLIGTTMDGSAAPWGQHLGEVLARWHEAKIHLENAWEMVGHRPPAGMERPPFAR